MLIITKLNPNVISSNMFYFKELNIINNCDMNNFIFCCFSQKLV